MSYSPWGRKSCIRLRDSTRTSKLGDSISSDPEIICSEEVGGGVRLHRILQQRACSLNIRSICGFKKTRHCKLRDLVLFYVWEFYVSISVVHFYVWEIYASVLYVWASLMAQQIKNPPAMQETQEMWL